MAKKDKEKAAKDLEEHDEEREDERDEDEDEEAVSAKAPPAARSSRAKAQARRKAHEHEDQADHAHGHDHDDDDDDAYDDEEDPYWWTPYSVMAALVLIGILGFVGVFNKILGPIAAHPVAEGAASASSEPAKASAPMPPTPPNPHQPPMPGQKPQAGEMLGAKHLLVAYQGSRRAAPTITRSKDEAKKRAEEAQKKAKGAPAKFEDVVKEYSDDPTAGNNKGDLGKFPKGSMVPEFQTALEKIKPGEVSDVVETPFGFHVILRTQ